MTTQASTQTGDKVPAKHEPTMSERFTNAVMAEFSAIAGQSKQLSPHKKRLVQNLFLCVDTSLKTLEADRAAKKPQKKPIVWANIHMPSLALDAMQRIDLGLDASISNHISVIPYLNGQLGKYVLDLRVGYEGKAYYRKKFAIDVPMCIIYELVYQNDTFTAQKAVPFMPTNGEAGYQVETYDFKITDAFNRGKVVGGFGYLMFDDPRKNRLILVTEADFLKAEKAAGTDKFWGPHPTEMRWKTLKHRVTEKLEIDPEKVTSSFTAVESADNEMAVDAEVAEEANQTPLDIDPDTGEVKNEALQTETVETVESTQPEGDNGEPKTKEPGF